MLFNIYLQQHINHGFHLNHILSTHTCLKSFKYVTCPFNITIITLQHEVRTHWIWSFKLCQNINMIKCKEEMMLGSKNSWKENLNLIMVACCSSTNNNLCVSPLLRWHASIFWIYNLLIIFPCKKEDTRKKKEKISIKKNTKT